MLYQGFFPLSCSDRLVRVIATLCESLAVCIVSWWMPHLKSDPPLASGLWA